MSKLYAVRQYRPGYCTGFKNETFRNIAYNKILDCSFFNNFKGDSDGGFDKFVIEPYSNDELIISAYYNNGKHWVAGFALPMLSKAKAPDGGLMINNWRYKNHES